MTHQDFTYWLNGFVELNNGQCPTPAQWKSICEHLSLVFNKVTPQVTEIGISTNKPFSGTPDPFISVC